MNHVANTSILAVLALLVASAVILAGCDAAAHEDPLAPPATDPTALAPTARTGLAPGTLQTLAANVTPFDRFRFRGNTEFTQADRAGTARYEATFRLGPNNNGLNPADEDTHLRIGPNPQAPFHPTPCFDVFIPAGCFKPGQDGFSVEGLGCGVEVGLHDANGNTTDLTPFVAGFRASLAPQTLRRWKAAVEIDVHTFSVHPPPDPWIIMFSTGDDGVALVPLDSRTRLVGIVVPEM